MGSRKNHHFVPQFYFRFFSEDQRSINVLRRDNGVTVAKAPIKSQSSKAWFYGDDQVESAIGEIEGTCSRSLRRLIETQSLASLSIEEIKLVLAWIVLQRSRTMSARQMHSPIFDRYAQLLVETELGKEEELTDEQFQAAKEVLPYVEADKVQLQIMMMYTALQSAQSLEDLGGVVLVNKTNRPFIFGDAPVVFYNGLCRDVKFQGVLGLETPGLMIIFPLTQKLCLLLVDQHAYQSSRVRSNGQIHVRDLRDVAALNKLQIHAASSCVYFHGDEFAPYVRELWSQEKDKIRTHYGHVIETKLVSPECPEADREFIHTFEPQLPYRLNLSFLRHEVLDDQVQIPVARNQKNYETTPFA